MKMITSFDPTLASSGTFDPLVANSCGRVLLFNESAIGIQLNFIDGSVQNLPPYYYRSFLIRKPGIVSWTMLYSINLVSSPLSVVIGEAYESQEAKNIVFSEGPLNRQTNVANTVATAGGSVDNVLNLNHPAGTVFLSSDVTGDSNLAVSITNDAQVLLGDAAHAAAVLITGSETVTNALTVNGTSSLAGTNVFGSLHMVNQNIVLDNGQQVGFFDTAVVLRQVLALSNTNITVLSGMQQFLQIRDQSGNVHFTFDVANNLIQFPQSGGFSLQGPSGAVVLTTSILNSYLNGSNSSNLQAGGTTVLNCQSNGINCLQRLNFSTIGGITAESIFSGTTVANTVVNINHGLTVNPDWCGAAIFSTTSTTTMSWTWNATQIHVLAVVGGLTVSCVAFKF